VTSVITNLTDHFLIATSELEDSVFDKSIIYIYEHTIEGAMGVIINHPMKDVTFEQVVDDVGVAANIECLGHIDIFQGGPVEVQRGFVIHTTDYKDGDTLAISADVAISTTGDVVSAIANSRGPKHFNFCLGYSGWGSQQLEDEVAENVWLVLPRTNDILFTTEPKKRYEKAIAMLGMSSIPETGNIGVC
jgi:putative transcriptional regulator